MHRLSMGFLKAVSNKSIDAREGSINAVLPKIIRQTAVAATPIIPGILQSSFFDSFWNIRSVVYRKGFVAHSVNQIRLEFTAALIFFKH